MPIYWQVEWWVPRLCGRSCEAAGVRRSGLTRQHAVADSSGGQSQGQDREELQPVAKATAFS